MLQKPQPIHGSSRLSPNCFFLRGHRNTGRFRFIGLFCASGWNAFRLSRRSRPHKHPSCLQQCGEVDPFRPGCELEATPPARITEHAFVILGALLTRHLEFKFAEFILGLFLIFFSLLLWFRPTARLAPTSINAITCGGIAGFLAGLIGTGGAVRGLVLAAFDLEKNAFVATSAAIDTGVDFSRMIIYLRSGYLTQNLYWLVPGLLLTAFVGSYTGKILLKRIQQESFRKIVLLLVLVDWRNDARPIRLANGPLNLGHAGRFRRRSQVLSCQQAAHHVPSSVLSPSICRATRPLRRNQKNTRTAFRGTRSHDITD